MTISAEFTKLTNAKHRIRKAISRKETGLTTSHAFKVYPDYLDTGDVTYDSDGLLDYSEDGTSIFTIPTSTTAIRDYAFYDYTALKYLVIPSTTMIPLEGTHAFTNTLIPTSGYIYVPSSLVSTYKAADNWSAYAARITSGTAPTETTTYLVEHEETCGGRTVSWISGLSIEELTKDNRT